MLLFRIILFFTKWRELDFKPRKAPIFFILCRTIRPRIAVSIRLFTDIRGCITLQRVDSIAQDAKRPVLVLRWSVLCFLLFPEDGEVDVALRMCLQILEQFGGTEAGAVQVAVESCVVEK